jgi:hypothetical protein
MKWFKYYTLTLALLLSMSVLSQAQTLPEEGNLGIRANIGGQTSIELPYMLSESFSLAPYIGFQTTENANTNLNIGVSPRYYLGVSEALATYVTGNLGITNVSSNNTNNSNTNFNLGAGYGAEYFFSSQFSLSADAGLTSRFGDSPSNFGTVVRVSASFYF